MNAITYRFLEPLDVLFLRGNKLFGDPGSYGESLVPPWPSVASGALRSRLLADEGVDLAAFAAGRLVHPTLGTPDHPGAFRITCFQMARRLANGRIEALIAPPVDLVINEQDGKVRAVRAFHPTAPAAGVRSSSPLPMLPVLAAAERGKAASGYWLGDAGWRRYLTGQTPLPGELITSSELWRLDPRVGVGLDAATGRAADGRLFAVQAVAVQPGVGFLAGIAGAVPPASGMVRLGGDGRAAAIHTATANTPEPDYAAIARTRRCRLVLATPGIFPAGWTLPGTHAAGHFHLGEVRGRLACAAVTRAEIVSGWDLAHWQPKSARRAAPAGSVYWLDELDATPEALRKLVNQGLWSEPCEDSARRAEGFNRIWLATWK
jgi:CRISPR-associated protein Cmr3